MAFKLNYCYAMLHFSFIIRYYTLIPIMIQAIQIYIQALESGTSPYCIKQNIMVVTSGLPHGESSQGLVRDEVTLSVE
jgi:hypothetical protein